MIRPPLMQCALTHCTDVNGLPRTIHSLIVLIVTPNSNFVFNDWYLWGWVKFPRKAVMNTHDFWSCLEISNMQADTECVLYHGEKGTRSQTKPAFTLHRIRENTALDPTSMVIWSRTGRFQIVQMVFYLYPVLIRQDTYPVAKIITISESKQVRLLMFKFYIRSKVAHWAKGWGARERERKNSVLTNANKSMCSCLPSQGALETTGMAEASCRLAWDP